MVCVSFGLGSDTHECSSIGNVKLRGKIKLVVIKKKTNNKDIEGLVKILKLKLRDMSSRRIVPVG